MANKLMSICNILLFIILVAVNVNYCSGAEIKLCYEIVTNGKVGKEEFIIADLKNGYTFKGLYPDMIQILECNELSETIKCRMVDNKTNREIIAAKNDNEIIIKSGNISKTINTNNISWYQSVYLLKGFILSENMSREYWTINSTILGKEIRRSKELDIFKLIAKKEKEDIIEIDGGKIKTVKVMVTFHDFRSIFWKAYYWFRKSDGILVKFEETRGGPGTPKTTGQLMRED